MQSTTTSNAEYAFFSRGTEWDFYLNKPYAESQSKSFNTFQSIGIIRTVFFGDSEIKLETSNKKITRKSPWREKKHFITCSK